MAGTPSKNSRTTTRTLTFEYVKGAARGRWREIASQVFGIGADYLTGRHGPCPKCGGDNRWRTYEDFEQTGGAICNKCGRDLGDGFKLGDWATGKTKIETLNAVASHLGFEVETNGQPRSRSKTEIEPIELEPLNELLAMYWCSRKSPITLAGLHRCGAQHGKLRDQQVIALPAFGESLTSEPATRFTAWRADGGKLPKWEKKDGKWQVTGHIKSRVTSGGAPGLHGPVAELADASHVWKVEGPTDLLAFYSAFADSLPLGHIAIATANGAGEHPQRWMLELLAGKTIYVLHDADKPGQDGAPQWSTTIAPASRVLLPYPIEEVHGKDLRDWLQEGHSFSELQSLADQAAPLTPTDPPASVDPASTADEEPTPNEAIDDPHRLARVNLSRYASLTDGGTIRHWRNEWYVYKRNRYRKLEGKEFAAKVGLSIKEEFNRANILAQRTWEEQKQRDPESAEPRPEARKVTQTLINNVVHATAGTQMISGNLELNYSLEKRNRRNWIGLANGILDVDALLDDREADEVLHPHTNDWFSTVCLPYEFDPTASCPRWLSFLDRCMGGNEELISILQEWAGYLLLPNTDLQKFLINEGEGGNGKSVYSAGVQAMLGVDNCSFISFERFGDRFALGGTIGKLVNIIDDMGEMDRVAEGHLKWFTSGQMFNIDRKGISAIDCMPTARIMCNTNVRPRFADKSAALWRRMLLIPWKSKISKTERIIGLDKKEWWQGSGELPGVFLWALKGLHRLRLQKDFTYSAIVEEGIADYRTEVNPAREFLLEYLEPTERGHVRTNSVYGHYRKWCERNGYHSLGDRQFGKEVKRCFPESDKSRGGARSDRFWYYSGLRYLTDEICGEKTDDTTLF